MIHSARTCLVAFCLILIAPFVWCSGEEVNPLDAIAARVGPYQGKSAKGVDVRTLTGKVMCGYQGWFRAEGDGTGLGWTHYQGRRTFAPGDCTIDLWPDMSELGDDERYPTEFRHKDGSVASVFSSCNKKTVLRHFQWMKEYGIDGVFVQRFTGVTGNSQRYEASTETLSYCREGANLNGRTYALMYDTNFDVAALARVKADWCRLIDHMRLTSDPAYLHHSGGPVIALWGCGFTHRRWDARATSELLDFLKNDPKYGGATIMLGVPTWWRSLRNDCRPDKSILEVIKKADIISPWTVGRYRTPEEAVHHGEHLWRADMQWCRDRKKDYLPVVFPGFSWHNMKPKDPLDQIPRLGGRFLWQQYATAHGLGATMVYQAMFDEIDEGTAIFKCTNNPPVGKSPFLTYEGLPSDHYLWLVGQASRMIRGEISRTKKMPSRVKQP